jgi:hypothetical protein
MEIKCWQCEERKKLHHYIEMTDAEAERELGRLFIRMVKQTTYNADEEVPLEAWDWNALPEGGHLSWIAREMEHDQKRGQLRRMSRLVRKLTGRL